MDPNPSNIPNPPHSYTHQYYCVRLETKLIHPDAKLPTRTRRTDAGYDLYSVEAGDLHPKQTKIIKTGVQISAPPGFYYTMEGRSSMWLKGVSPHRGIVDSTYVGEVVVSLVNMGDEIFPYNVGDRIAQLILHRQYDASFDIVDEFSPDYNQRGTKGFGSTGK